MKVLEPFETRVKVSKKHRLERIDKKFSIEKILPKIPDQLIDRRQYKREELDGDKINFNSLRLMTFKIKGTICSGCGIKGSFFVKEKHHTLDEPYHLNLYALDENNEEILMTMDHIIPKYKNGPNTIDNAQTMCKICNELKDHKLLIICPICNKEKGSTKAWCSECEKE